MFQYVQCFSAHLAALHPMPQVIAKNVKCMDTRSVLCLPLLSQLLQSYWLHCSTIRRVYLLLELPALISDVSA